MSTRARSLLGLHLLLALYSVTNVFSKLASEQDFLSWQFVVFYGLVLLILAIYALGWQQAIKRMPLTTAYANKAVTVVWGIVFGMLFFGENLNAGMIVGAALIIGGVAWFGIEDGRCQDELEAQMRQDLEVAHEEIATVSGLGNLSSAQTVLIPLSGAEHCGTAPGQVPQLSAETNPDAQVDPASLGRASSLGSEEQPASCLTDFEDSDSEGGEGRE